MEIFNEETNRNEKYNDNTPSQGFFPRSELNDWLPIWEKIVFLLFGFIGMRLITMLVKRIIILTPLVVIKDGIATLTTFGSAFLNFLIYLIVMLGFLAFLFFDRRKTYQRLFKDFAKPETYIWAAIGFGLVFASQTILGNLFNLIPWYGTGANQDAVSKITLAQPLLMIITTVIFAPFVEELTYRIGIVDTVGHKYKFRWLGIAASALLFGLIRIDIITPWMEMTEALAEGVSDISSYRYQIYTELLSLLIYVSSGFALAFTYAKSGKIASSMTSHMAVNIVSMISIFVSAAIQNGAATSSSSQMFFLGF